MKRIIATIILLALLCGCANQSSTELVPLNKTVQCSKPYITNQGSCCLDMNDNNACDYLENPATTTSTHPGETTTSMNPGVTTTTLQGYCSNGVLDNNETGIDCGGSCEPCESTCENLINDSITKPAARTVKLCLSSASKTEYMGANYSVEEAGGIMNVVVTGLDGNVSRAMLLKGRDESFGNTLIRFIGSAKQGSTIYAQVYAWTIEGRVKCALNIDCGETKSLGTMCLNGRRVVEQFLSYRCMDPGTIFSSCQAQQTSEEVIVCSGNSACMDGDVICVPETCLNGIFDDNEDGRDCGGECRPCRCFDKTMNGAEEGIDCGGECRPCNASQLPANRTLTLSIRSPANTIHRTGRLDLAFSASKDANCSYSLNGGSNTYIGARRNATIYAPSGQNTLILICTDSEGNNASAQQRFTVYIPKTRACPEDNVSAEYNMYFDEAEFFGEDESILGSTERCQAYTFEYSLSYLKDSDQHAQVSNETLLLRDGNTSRALNSRIYYDCRDTGKLSISYARLESSAVNLKANETKIVLYFTETRPVGVAGSYWRIYAYERGKDSVDIENYIDIGYAPQDSFCGNASALRFQELDISALARRMGQGSLVIRLGFYTSKINSEITLSEIELAGEQGRT